MALNQMVRISTVYPEAKEVGNSPIGCHTRLGSCGEPTMSFVLLNPTVHMRKCEFLFQERLIGDVGPSSQNLSGAFEEWVITSPAHLRPS